MDEANPGFKKYLQNKRGVLTINGIHTLHRFYKIAQIINSNDELRVEEIAYSNNSFKSVLGEDYARGILKLGSIPFEFEISYRNNKCENGFPIEYETKIFGERGELHVIGWEGCELNFDGKRTRLYAHPEGHLNGKSHYLRIEIGLREQIKNFFKFIQSGEKIHPTIKESIEAQKLVEECYRVAKRD